jgi:multiple sugar transport system substrate-binding protein/raffinose/stachyose/melibiose transport system substrate-binding protein
VGAVDGIVMPAQAFNPDGAERVLEYLAGESGQTAMAKGSGGFAPNRLVDPTIYSPVQREIKDSIVPDDGWSLQYDSACPPAVAAEGLPMFAEFLEFPWLYPNLLEGMQSRTRSSY